MLITIMCSNGLKCMGRLNNTYPLTDCLRFTYPKVAVADCCALGVACLDTCTCPSR